MYNDIIRDYMIHNTLVIHIIPLVIRIMYDTYQSIRHNCHTYEMMKSVNESIICYHDFYVGSSCFTALQSLVDEVHCQLNVKSAMSR